MHLDYKELLEEAGLQQIQKRLSTVTGLVALVADPNGKPITRLSNLCSFCAMINNTKPGRARCTASRIELAKAAAKSGQPVVQLCHAGLTHIALPIKIKNETVAVVIGGNASLEPLRLEIVQELAKELGVNGEELTEAARRVPVWPEERLRETVELFHAFTDTLSRLLYSRQELQEKTEELNEIGYLAIIASQVGLAIGNAYESLREYYMSAVRVLAAALEAKDKYTQGHSLRVARWAKAVAQKMGLSEEEQEMVYIGGLLHDIGKVGVRGHVLLKAGKLTPAEQKEIQAHPSAGAKILEPAKLPKEVVEAVLYHHEDYGGGGYPEGIAGEKIPLLARIIRVVDSYDAMTSDRPYRRAFSQERVIEELKRCSGKQFDPAVVEAMKKVLEQDKTDCTDLVGRVP